MYAHTIFIEGRWSAVGANLIEKFARLRYRRFVRELKWNLPLARDGIELDQFDNDSAHYAIGVTSRGDVLAGIRLHSTAVPTLINTVYSGLISDGPPRSHCIWEGTRMVVDEFLVQRSGERTALRRLLGDVVEYGLGRGVQKFVSVSDPFLERVLRSVGAMPRRLGPVVEVQIQPRVVALALEMHCSLGSLARLRDVALPMAA